MYKRYVCSICGKSYNDLALYMDCVSTCGKELGKKLEKEKEEAAKMEAEAKKRAEEVNAALNGVKQAKAYYEQKLNEFKEKYPEEYEINFGSNDKSCSCGGNCKCDSDARALTKEEFEKEENGYKDIEFSYESNGKDEPKLYARVNGKKVDDAHVKTLLEDPEVDWIAKMLGLV